MAGAIERPSAFQSVLHSTLKQQQISQRFQTWWGVERLDEREYLNSHGLASSYMLKDIPATLVLLAVLLPCINLSFPTDSPLIMRARLL